MSNKYSYVLTKFDDQIPVETINYGDELFPEEKIIKKYIPIYGIMRNKEFHKLDYRFQDNEENVQKMRKDSFKRIKKVFDESNRDSLVDYWNNHRKQIIETDINCFYRNKGLAPLAHLIEMVEVINVTKNSKKTKKARYVSFVIRKEYIVNYLENQIIPEIPKSKGRPKSVDIEIQKIWYAKILDSEGKEKTVKANKTPTYEMFCKICNDLGLNKKQGLEMCLHLFVETYNQELLSNKKYKPEKTTMDILIEKDLNLIKQTKNQKSEHRTINFNPKLLALINRIILNFNSDSQNSVKGKLSISKFVSMACKELIDRNEIFSIKYGNPELYNEIKYISDSKE